MQPGWVVYIQSGESVVRIGKMIKQQWFGNELQLLFFLTSKTVVSYNKNQTEAFGGDAEDE